MLLVGCLIFTGCSYLGGRSALVVHKGPNQIFTLKTPKDATFTKVRNSKKTGSGTVLVHEEKVGGSCDLPADVSAGVGTKEMLDTLTETIIESLGGKITSSKFVNKLGFSGLENEFDIPNKTARGRSIFWRAGRSVYFCQYYSLNSIWDNGRAESILTSFRFSTLKRH